MLTEAELLNGQIYFEAQGTLAQRIDFAWSIYASENPTSPEAKEKALKFLVYAFDLDDTQDVNQQLINLMAERQKYQTKNPEYIPNKQPKKLPIDSREIVLGPINSTRTATPKEIGSSIKSKELLDVGSYYKETFDPKRATYLTAEERAKFRINIRNGIFVKDGQPFDTSTMRSHGKQGYGAYTLNANGEISVFIHNMGMGTDRMFHSSMNAGAPVVAAGELKIQNGVLIEITTSSGHYRPSLFNVQRALEHFVLNKIDISQTQVRTFVNPSSSLKGVISVQSYDDEKYLTHATHIYKGMNELFKDNVESIQTQVKSYTDSGGFLNAIFKLTNSKLTQDRAELAALFEQAIAEFQQNLTTCTSDEILNTKISELETIVTGYQEKNNKLSRQHGKADNSGRLGTRMMNFKENLNTLKSGETSKTPEAQQITKTMKRLS